MVADRVDDCIEALCETGCDAVRAAIEAMEEGQGLAQTEGLSEAQRKIVLGELKSIMAVYDRR